MVRLLYKVTKQFDSTSMFGFWREECTDNLFSLNSKMEILTMLILNLDKLISPFYYLSMSLKTAGCVERRLDSDQMPLSAVADPVYTVC